MSSSNSKISRRDVISSLSLVGLAGLLGYGGISLYRRRAEFSALQESIIVGGKYKFNGPQAYKQYLPHTSYRENFLYKLDLLNNVFEEVATTTPTHTTQPHPFEPNLVFCSSRRSDRSSLFDWNSKKEISSILSNKEEYMFGHSAFTEDGRHVLVAIIDFSLNPKKPRGLFYVLEVPSLKKVDVIIAGEFTAHDILQTGQDTFVCGTLCEQPGTASFGIIDFKNRKFEGYVKKIENFEKYVTMTHVKKNNNDIYGIGNILEDGSLKDGVLVKFDSRTKEINLEFSVGSHELLNEILSIEYDIETNYIWMTVPTQNAILVWDANQDKLLKVIKDWRLPRSVILANSIDAMIVGTEAGFKAYDRKNFTNKPKIDEKWGGLNLKYFTYPHTRLI